MPEQTDQPEPEDRYGFVVTYAHGGDEEFWFPTEYDRDSQIGHYGPELGCTTHRVSR